MTQATTVQSAATVSPMRMPPNSPDSRIAGRKVMGPKPSLMPPSIQRRAEASRKKAPPVARPRSGRSRGSLRKSDGRFTSDP